MAVRMRTRPPASARALACLALLLATTGCSLGGDDDGSAFLVKNTAHATTTQPPTVADGWIVYLASEFADGATDLNGDGDAVDAVACLFNVKAGTDTVLGVAAVAHAVLGNNIYLVVDEAADGRDWNQDADQLDYVLVHQFWNEALPLDPLDDTLDTLVDAPLPVPLLRAGNRLYYGSATAGPAVGETGLRYVDLQNPTTPTSVFDVDGRQVLIRLVAEQAGLLFLAADETIAGLVLNDDGDASDPHVLALLDTTDPDAMLKIAELALPDVVVPVGAAFTAANDWTVAFLVSELQQGADLNDPTLFPPGWVAEHCGAVADGDQQDLVLHHLDYAAWFNGSAAPVNTGLAGVARALAFEGAVATLADEQDSGCDLNDDGDLVDFVPRWIATTPGALPAGSHAQMLAVRTVPGGAWGLSWNSNKLVAVLSEELSGRDLDTSAQDHDLVAWLDPEEGTAATWRIAHQSSTIGTGISGLKFVGSDWLAEKPRQGRLGLSFEESTAGDVLGLPNFTLNNCLAGDLVVKDSDGLDSLPVWSDFEGEKLDFDGIGYALATNNAGIVVVGGQVFFRGNENNDNRSYNDDADMADDILFRNPVASGCTAVAMSTATALDEPVVYSDGLGLVAFHCDEAQAGVDYNGDGDQLDFVLRGFRF